MGFSFKGKSIDLLGQLCKKLMYSFIALVVLYYIAIILYWFNWPSYMLLHWIYFVIIIYLIFGYNELELKNSCYSIFKGKFVQYALLTVGLVYIILLAQNSFILTEEQKIFAEKAVHLSEGGGEVSVSSWGYIRPTAKGDQKIAEGTITQGEIILDFTIDLDNGAMVEKSQTPKRYYGPAVCC